MGAWHGGLRERQSGSTLSGRSGTRPPQPYTHDVSVVPHPDEPIGLTVLPPDEALKQARPLPTDDEMAIDGLTDDEWKAFEAALAER